MTHKKVNNADAGTATKFGGNDLDKWSDFASGVDTDDYDINSDISFRTGKRKLRNPANTFNYIEATSAIVADRTVTEPLLTTNDTRVYQAHPQTLSNKIMSEVTNSIGVTGAAKYTVFKVGSTYYAKNGETGVIDDSDTDPTSVIQFALDNLTAGRSNIETVKLRGDFTISKIIIPSICALDLREARLFQANSTNTVMIENADTINGNVGIEIMGGLIDGNRANQTGAGTAAGTSLLRFSKCSHVNIHDGVWIHANYHCFFFQNCPFNIRLTNNRVENWKQEGVCDQAQDVADGSCYGHIVANNYFSHTSEGYGGNVIGSCAIATVNVYDYVFNGNVVKNTMAGSSTTFNGVRSNVTNNIILDGAGAVGAIGVGTTSAGIVLSQGAGSKFDTSDSIVANNIVHNMGKVGIHVQQAFLSENIIITGNYVSQCGEAGGTTAGIHVQESDNCIISNNIVRDCYGSGIRVNGSTIHSMVNGVISNNICWNNGRGLSTTDNHRSGIVGDAGTGSTVANIMVMGNRCFDKQGTKTQKYGVRLNNGLNCVVRFNDVRDNLTAGCIYATSTGTTTLGNVGFD